MATVLERPQVSKALPPEQVKGRQSAMAIPEGGYFPDKVEQGRFGPIFPRTPLNYGFTIIAKIKPGTAGELLPVRPQYRGGRCRHAGPTRRPEAPHAEMGAVRHQGRHLLHVPGHLRHRLRQIYRGRGHIFSSTRAQYRVREPRRLPGGLEIEPAGVHRFVREHHRPSFLEYAEYSYVTANEVKSALEVKNGLANVLDNMQL